MISSVYLINKLVTKLENKLLQYCEEDVKKKWMQEWSLKLPTPPKN